METSEQQNQLSVPVPPKHERSGVDKFLDRASKVFAIFGGIAMIWVTWHFSDVASGLSEQSIEVAQIQRRYSIRPNLEVLSGFNYTDDYEAIVVPIRNYGAGRAVAVRALVACDGEMGGEIHHQFITAADESVTGSKVMRNALGSQQEMLTLGVLSGKDWIAPDETVRFQFNTWFDDDPIPRTQEKVEEHFNREFTIFLSYFDVDRTEYLSVTKTSILGRSSVLMIATDVGMNDSLLAISSSVKSSSSKVFENTHFRTEDGWFIDLTDDSVADSMELPVISKTATFSQ